MSTITQANYLFATPSKGQIAKIFRKNVFTEAILKKHLKKGAWAHIKPALTTGKINSQMANVIAKAMLGWALSKKVTHFTHWFQPLTGVTAEKHDTFAQLTKGRMIEQFSGSALIQQEPDASSFPSGGLRNTFEARGYSAWDPSSPPFIMEIDGGKTLCIPSVFISYTGEALDYKTPLLKSLAAVEEAAIEVCRYFDPTVTRVQPTLGWEQEYFVIAEDMYNARPDLVMSGRTVFGHAPAKGQQLEDHYFGSIPKRVYSFMVDFETECYKLGIPIKTRHNEVAPSQFECAPIFEEVNLAIDHNQLLMDIMQRVARKHHLHVLLHEKPFAGINGSGKHCNWSMGTNTGINLLSPGKNPETNLQFLTFFVNVIKAVHDHADLLRASIATSGNEHRLGANEAPPAIISVFIGSHMTELLDEIEKAGAIGKKELKNMMIEIHKTIPLLAKDNTDRNRTSPFAFTGNKFEVRAVGSSQNTSATMIVLNTIVADTLRAFSGEVDAQRMGGRTKEVAIMDVLQKYIMQSKNIRYESNNYSDEWIKEAGRRGLPNIKEAPDALAPMIKRANMDLYVRNQVFTHKEVHARYEIELEKYTKQVQIEGRIIEELSLTHILPAALEYRNHLMMYPTTVSRKLSREIANHVSVIEDSVRKMTEARKRANKITDVRKRAIAYNRKVKPLFEEIRYHADKLELIIDDKLWPLPKYREMLFH